MNLKKKLQHPMIEDPASAIKNWIPYKLFNEDGNIYCQWLCIKDIRFTDPFFDETILRGRGKLTYNDHMLKSISSPDVLTEWSATLTSIQPSAVIFHVSRCGSTLAGQLLGLNPGHIVLSEVPFFDELMRWGYNDPCAKEASLQSLKAAIAIYGARRNPEQNRLFIKTESWHIFFYRQYRQLYPHTPFILLYRQPEEVIISQQKRRGMPSVQGLIEPALFGFDIENIAKLSLDQYMALVLERYYESFIEILKSDPLAIPVNYNEGALQIVKKIAEVSNTPLRATDLEQMKQRAKYDAKYPGDIFTTTNTKTEITADPGKAWELYEAIEKIRVG